MAQIENGGSSTSVHAIVRPGLVPKTEITSRGHVKHLTYCPSHFRKTAHTLHRDRIGNAANWITGHKGATVGERFYYNAFGKVMDSVMTMPQPEEFVNSVSAGD